MSEHVVYECPECGPTNGFEMHIDVSDLSIGVECGDCGNTDVWRVGDE